MVALAIIVGDGLRVADDYVGHPCGEPFGESIPGFRERVPFLAISLQAVDVDRDRHAEHARHPSVDGVGGVAVEHGVLTVKQQVQG